MTTQTTPTTSSKSRNWADEFLRATDISDCVDRCAQSTQGAARGMSSALACLMWGILAGLMFWVTWSFDWAATAQGVHSWIGALYSMGPAGAATYISLQTFTNIAVFLPTIIEFAGPYLTRLRISVAGWLFYLFICFDFITDFPVASAFFANHASTVFDWAGAFEFIPYSLSLWAFIVFVSLFAQLFFFCSAVLSIGYFRQTFWGPINAKRYQ